MIHRILSFCIRHRGWVLWVAGLVTAASLWAFHRAPLDALPDVSEPQIILVCHWQKNPLTIEENVLRPLARRLLRIRGVRTVRGFADLGYGFLYALLEENASPETVRREVGESLDAFRENLPPSARVFLGPEASSVGWVYQYALLDRTRRMDLRQLRDFHESIVKPALEEVPGVAEVATAGGLLRQYRLEVDPRLLAQYDLPFSRVRSFVERAGRPLGGRIVEISGREYLLEGRASFRSLRDLEDSVIARRDGRPIRLRELGTIRVGNDIRRGLTELNGDGEVVGGIVVMRDGENALRVIQGVKKRLKEIRNRFPEGVETMPVYDRSGLIRASVRTLGFALTEEILLVSAVLFLFLGRWRLAFLPAVVLPLCSLLPFLGLSWQHQTVNLMTLAGIALALGEVGDAAIVMVENVQRRLCAAGPVSGQKRREILLDACFQVARPVFFSLGVILLSFLPVFLLQGEEGRLLRPLAWSKTWAMGFSAVLAVTLVPAAIGFFAVSGAGEGRLALWLQRRLTAAYDPVLRLCLRRRGAALGVNFALLLASLPLMRFLGQEYLPPLREGSLLYMPSALPGFSDYDLTRALEAQGKWFASFPEVKSAFGKIGRAETATDPAPMTMMETTIELKPRAQWRPGMTWERLLEEMDRKVRLPGWTNAWTQPIRGRIDMLSTGIQTPFGVKLLGEDLPALEEAGRRVEAALRDLPGARSVYAERSPRGYFLEIEPDPGRASRLGIPLPELEEIVEYGIGGQSIGRWNEAGQEGTLAVRFPQDLLSDLEKIRRLWVGRHLGRPVLLSEVADIRQKHGPDMVRNEEGRLSLYVTVDVAARDLGVFARSARRALQRLDLPAGVEWRPAGQWEARERAARKMWLVGPLALGVMVALLYLAFHSWREAGLILLSVPYALVGGLWLQAITRTPMSVAAWVGYLSLYAVAVQTGVVMVVYLQEALDRRRQAALAAGKSLTREDVRQATYEGALLRLRPKLMTVATTVFGMIPLLLATGPGAELARPIALPILGGMLTSTLHVLLITPCLFYLVHAPRE